jgi:hypothetical protein
MSSITKVHQSSVHEQQATSAVKQEEQTDSRQLVSTCEAILSHFGKDVSRASTMAEVAKKWLPFKNFPFMYPVIFSIFSQLDELIRIDEDKGAHLKQSFHAFASAYFKEYSFFRFLDYQLATRGTFENNHLPYLKKDYTQRCKPFARQFISQLISFCLKVTSECNDEQKKVMFSLRNDIVAKVDLLARLCSDQIHQGFYEKNYGKRPGRSIDILRSVGARFTPENILPLPKKTHLDTGSQLALQGFAFFESYYESHPFTTDENMARFKELKKALIQSDITTYQKIQKEIFDELERELSDEVSTSITQLFDLSVRVLFNYFVYLEFRHFTHVCEANLENQIQAQNPLYESQEDLYDKVQTLFHTVVLEKPFPQEALFPGKRKFFTNFEASLKKWHDQLDLSEIAVVLHESKETSKQRVSQLYQCRFRLCEKDAKGIPFYQRITDQMVVSSQKLEQMGHQLYKKVTSELKKIPQHQFASKKSQIVDRWKTISKVVIKKVLIHYYLLRLMNVDLFKGKSPEEIERMEIEADDRLSGLISYLSFDEKLKNLKFHDLQKPKVKEKERSENETKEQNSNQPKESVVALSPAVKKEVYLQKTKEGTFKLNAPKKEYPTKPAAVASAEEETKQIEAPEVSVKESTNDPERSKLVTQLKQTRKIHKLMRLLKQLGYDTIVQGSRHTLVQVGDQKFAIPRHSNISKGVVGNLASVVENDTRD